MLNFLDLAGNELVDEYIRAHTHLNENVDYEEHVYKNGIKWSIYNDTRGIRKQQYVYSAVRDTASQAFEWRYHIEESDMLEIQEACAKPMAELGYKAIEKNNLMSLSDFNDLLMTSTTPNKLFE